MKLLPRLCSAPLSRVRLDRTQAITIPVHATDSSTLIKCYLYVPALWVMGSSTNILTLDTIVDDTLSIISKYGTIALHLLGKLARN